jgi:formylglycine-generating enzyme required for sulfatase activity
MIQQQLTLFCLLLLVLLPGLGLCEPRTALVIGNSTYTDSPLSNPKNDAEDIAALLRELQFEVSLKTNADQQEMEQAIRDFGTRLQSKGGVGLFFYAGHGIQSQGSNYLIPVNAVLEREKDLRYKAVNLGQILDEMRFAQNPLNLVILDACRNNPLTRSFRSGERGLAPINDAPSGLLLAYSTSPNQVAADGDGRNSPFTLHLKQALVKPGLPLELTFKEVVKGVKRSTANKQIPWYNSSVSGDFYFKPAPAGTRPASTGNVTPAAAMEASLDGRAWALIEHSKNVEDFIEFQNEFPDSKLVFHARVRARQLNEEQESPKQAALTVRTEPEGARIRILNIVPVYQEGMRLPPGEYELEVSHPGYQTRRSRITLGNTDRVEWVQLSPQPRLSETLGMTFVDIPGGSFMMGSNDGDPDEKPVHRVTISPFQLMTTEVTKGQFAKFIDATGYRTDAQWNAGGEEGCFAESSPGNHDWGWQKGKDWNNVVYSDGYNHPVMCVSHNDAMALIDWLNRNSAERYRLPTEAEWEYAARAGGTGKYSFGDSESALCTHANVADLRAMSKYIDWSGSDCTDGYVYTAPVGSFRANAFGLYDMHGNVWEWTQDCYSNNYEGGPLDGRARMNGDCDYRVLRGGGFNTPPGWLRSTYRYREVMTIRSIFLGLRLARDL